MQYKSQEAAMQAKSHDGQGKSHSHAPESGTYGAGSPRSTALASTTDADALAGAAREVLHERIAAVRRSLEALRAAVVARTRQGVRSVDDYVHAQPWKVIGAGAAAGVLIGWLLARRRQ